MVGFYILFIFILDCASRISGWETTGLTLNRDESAVESPHPRSRIAAHWQGVHGGQVEYLKRRLTAYFDGGQIEPIPEENGRELRVEQLSC